MKIGIVGLGYVGKAVQASYLSNEHTIIFCDPAIVGGVSLNVIAESALDAIFVCVPTLSRDDGSCDTSIVELVIDTLLESTYSGPIIVKSTTDITFWSKYPHPNVYHVPEFLVANRAVQDYLNPEFIVIGQNSGADDIMHIFTDSLMDTDVPVTVTDIVTASMIKYFMNTFLAAKVMFMNQFYRLNKSVNGNWEDFTRALQIDSRMGSSHFAVPGPDGAFGYGGACFPKDVRAIIATLQKTNTTLGLFEVVNQANQEVRNEQISKTTRTSRS
jgi:UDPglucose 6-dehydrogenase